MYSALDIAKYIIDKCTKEDCPISNLQLQKILYYIQKAYLKKHEYAFSDGIEAWQFGPVVPEVYYYFCGFGAMPITSRYEIQLENTQIIDKITLEKRELNPWDLVEETHKKDGAWDRIYRAGQGNKVEIPVEYIMQEA